MGNRKSVEKKLNKVDHDTIPKVPHKDEKILAKVIDVYDGDTCTVLFLHGNKVPMKIKIRVEGVDTPEVKGKGVTDLEKRAAKCIRDEIKDMLQEHVVGLEIKKWDKWGGRVVGQIYLPEPHSATYVTLSNYLLDSGYAKSYDGKTKKKDWSAKELSNIIASFDDEI